MTNVIVFQRRGIIGRSASAIATAIVRAPSASG